MYILQCQVPTNLGVGQPNVAHNSSLSRRRIPHLHTSALYWNQIKSKLPGFSLRPKDFFSGFFFIKKMKYAYKNRVLTQVPNSKEPHTTTAVARKTLRSDPCPSLPLYGAFPAAAPGPDAAMAPHAPLAPGGAAAGSHRATGSGSCCAPRPSCRVAVGRCQRLRWRKETEGAALQWSSSGDAAADEGSVAAIPGGTEGVRLNCFTGRCFQVLNCLHQVTHSNPNDDPGLV